MVGNLGWFVFLAGLVRLLYFIKDVGVAMVKQVMSGKEEVKIKLTSEEAVVPTRGSEGAASWDLSTTMHCQLVPGERRLLSTGITVEIPRGSYGRVTPRSSLASHGIDVARGVIDSDFRGELKVILVNHKNTMREFEVGNRVAQRWLLWW